MTKGTRPVAVVALEQSMPLDATGQATFTIMPGEREAGNGSRVHDSLVNVLGRQILGGTYKPGEMLPREEELGAMLGVSRTSLREAVKVLSAKGLVEARRRVGVRVRGREDWSLLDPAVLSWHPGIQDDEELMAGLIEARRIFEPAAAELAARRAQGSDLAAIEAAFAAMSAAVPEDFDGYCKADLAFHRSVIAASHNVVLRSLAGLMEAALNASFTITNTFMERQARALAVHGRVLETIRMRDTAGARTAMGRLLDLAAEDLHLH
ncbi:FadR/GntR family transcriptional regulator [Lichenifustis flavocetrariae]|uniref:FCD domain-containing protein n=1 Tax=Lichenifustis flavocetrariae TaxID=2949735 RepID=A0AA42CHS4_9HYPH|nr:FCD domain-containing protein [Lichenifustis flavocetrariae]MCW6507848.1 FCD domain-containing protein [Lichenifustis flavocetrariae]